MCVADKKRQIAVTSRLGQRPPLQQHLRGHVDSADVGDKRSECAAHVDGAGGYVQYHLMRRRGQLFDDPLDSTRCKAGVGETRSLYTELATNQLVVRAGIAIRGNVREQLSLLAAPVSNRAASDTYSSFVEP